MCRLMTLLHLLLFSSTLMSQIPDERGYIVSVGDEMPSFHLTAIDGTAYTNTSLLGSVAVLQFTASWCSVCRAEMPELERQVHQVYSDQGFTLIGVDYDEAIDKVTEFASATGITYPIAPDPGGLVFHSIAAPKSGVTRNVVIDRKGTIRFLTRLYDPQEFEAMVNIIEELIQER
jgi:peroxiredoxin